jgi:hypothetical protein
MSDTPLCREGETHPMIERKIEVMELSAAQRAALPHVEESTSLRQARARGQLTCPCVSRLNVNADK